MLGFLVQQQQHGNAVRDQNRKLDVLLVIAGAVACTYLWPHSQVWAYLVGALVGLELLQQWAGLAALVLLPVALVRSVHMRLTKRQLRNRTVYKVGGEEFVAQPITRSVQETLVAMVPDSAFEAATAGPGSLAGLLGATAQPEPDAADIRRTWLAGIDSTYEQLAYLLVRKANPDPYDDNAHPDVGWLGRVCPVARATSLLSEITERATIEDNLPA